MCTLLAVAHKQPQAAYAAVTHSLQFKWSFTLRVNSGCGPLMLELEDSLSSCFLPALFRIKITPVECQFFALPLKCGGLGIVNPVVIADCCYNSSLCSTAFLHCILGLVDFDLDAHITSVNFSKAQDKKS